VIHQLYGKQMPLLLQSSQSSVPESRLNFALEPKSSVIIYTKLKALRL
jgi:hypothetical protein